MAHSEFTIRAGIRMPRAMMIAGVFFRKR